MATARSPRRAGRGDANVVTGPAIGPGPTIDPGRLWARLMRRADGGALPGGGVDRQARRPGRPRPGRLVTGWAQEAGLQPGSGRACRGRIREGTIQRHRRLPGGVGCARLLKSVMSEAEPRPS